MFELPDLPYSYAALGRVISETTMRLHHDRHHARYVAVTNDLLTEADRGKSLEDVILQAKAQSAAKLFNNAAQAWNHAFFWACMTPDPAPPSGDLAAAIDAAFGSLDGLKAKFVEAGLNQFGSGWAWLVAKGETLSVIATHDAGTPLTEGLTPLLVCDVWEHAYYLDHQNDRGAFLNAWWDKVVNWRFAEAQFDAARGRSAPWRYPRPVEAAVS